MGTRDFLQSVKERINPEHFNLYGHHLHQIPDRHKDRYLLTLHYCNDICMAYSLLYKGRQLPDINYSRFIKFASSRV